MNEINLIRIGCWKLIEMVLVINNIFSLFGILWPIWYSNICFYRVNDTHIESYTHASGWLLDGPCGLKTLKNFYSNDQMITLIPKED